MKKNVTLSTVIVFLISIGSAMAESNLRSGNFRLFESEKLANVGNYEHNISNKSSIEKAIFSTSKARYSSLFSEHVLVTCELQATFIINYPNGTQQQITYDITEDTCQEAGKVLDVIRVLITVFSGGSIE
jgi:hypothetical protein